MIPVPDDPLNTMARPCDKCIAGRASVVLMPQGLRLCFLCAERLNYVLAAWLRDDFWIGGYSIFNRVTWLGLICIPNRDDDENAPAGPPHEVCNRVRMHPTAWRRNRAGWMTNVTDIVIPDPCEAALVTDVALFPHESGSKPLLIASLDEFLVVGGTDRRVIPAEMLILKLPDDADEGDDPGAVEPTGNTGPR